MTLLGKQRPSCTRSTQLTIPTEARDVSWGSVTTQVHWKLVDSSSVRASADGRRASRLLTLLSHSQEISRARRHRMRVGC